MNADYFSDREKGPQPRTEENITSVVWGAIAAIVDSLIEDGSFGVSFPATCRDGNAVIGTHYGQWVRVFSAEHPEISHPFHSTEPPATLAILDLVEFTFSHIAKPVAGDHHSFFSHHHLSFDREAGQEEFRLRINRLFSRNGLAFELGNDGKIIRLAPVVLREALQSALFQTGDSTLDSMLESARIKFLNPDGGVRRESLEKLWDAWERLKTIELGTDKKAQVKALLDKAATEPKFRELIEVEARALTEVGNNFLIRHSETNRTAIVADAHVDYVFHRLFALIWMILRMRVK